MSSVVFWYWGWVRLCRDAPARHAACGGTDCARQSPSSITPTAALSTAELPRELLILSHSPMFTDETGVGTLDQRKIV